MMRETYRPYSLSMMMLIMHKYLQEPLESVGLHSQSFGTAQEFLAVGHGDGPSCLILDVRLPGISGLELQHELKRGRISIPIIFLTARADVPMSVKAMKSGAGSRICSDAAAVGSLDLASCARKSELLLELRHRHERLSVRDAR